MTVPIDLGNVIKEGYLHRALAVWSIPHDELSPTERSGGDPRPFPLSDRACSIRQRLLPFRC